MAKEPEINTEFWNKQLADIDVSDLGGLPVDATEERQEEREEVPDKDRQDMNERNTLMVMATLAGALKEIKEKPDSMHSAVVVCRLANGTYRLFFPHSYRTVTLHNLAMAMAYFDEMIDQREEG
jgi:hypothetical protein